MTNKKTVGNPRPVLDALAAKSENNRNANSPNAIQNEQMAENVVPTPSIIERTTTPVSTSLLLANYFHNRAIANKLDNSHPQEAEMFQRVAENYARFYNAFNTSKHANHTVADLWGMFMYFKQGETIARFEMERREIAIPFVSLSREKSKKPRVDSKLAGRVDHYNKGHQTTKPKSVINRDWLGSGEEFRKTRKAFEKMPNGNKIPKKPFSMEDDPATKAAMVKKENETMHLQRAKVLVPAPKKPEEKTKPRFRLLSSLRRMIKSIISKIFKGKHSAKITEKEASVVPSVKVKITEFNAMHTPKASQRGNDLKLMVKPSGRR